MATTSKLLASTLAGLLLSAAACSPGNSPGEAKLPVAPQFIPAASIQDLMVSQIDPAADFIWDSVGTIITAAGTLDRQPRTAEQWAEVRRRVIALIEATNLLIIPGRRVASSAFPSDGPGVLSSADIERKLRDDPAAFNAFALALRGVALQALTAVDHQDAAALSQAGEAMDGACEACHVANWYPHQIIPPLPDFKADR